ncbi:response regulator, partial [Streptomyces sp. NPDC058412]|uniref:response regulator n=1 Tax=Streptomyces sp. NPDC058412 TaxID=3346486 RepID=UPI0036629E8A
DGEQRPHRGLARRAAPDVILLDLGLPDMDGTDVIKAVRGWSRTPVLVLSARHTSEEKIRALDAGADDYVTKPFSMDELLARLRAATRRQEVPAGSEAASEVTLITTDEFSVDLVARKVTRGERTVRLTPTEWHLLEILITNPGRLITQSRLLLEADPSHPRYLITEPGMGYRFEP